jgi:hypothetical protein
MGERRAQEGDLAKPRDSDISDEAPLAGEMARILLAKYAGADALA